MSQEEKAKAYDKAIETCKRVFNFNNLSYTHCEIKEKLEQIFPELSESEDERIRKEIISFIEYEEARGSIPDGWRQAKRPGKWIAYLEKQKGNTEGDFARGYDCGYECCLNSHGAEWLEKQKEQKPIISDVAIREGVAHFGITQYQIDNWLKKHINVVEQKPAEWSEDYREEDIQTRFAFYTYKDDSSILYLSNVFVEEASRKHGFGTRILRAAEKVAETIGATTISLKVKQDSPANAWYRKNGYGYVTFEDGYDWLEKNLEYLKPKKEVEWSEEDEENFKWFDKFFRTESIVIGGRDIPQDKYLWFKSLRPQPKQEWSEETMDEFTRNIRNLITDKLTVHTKGLDGSEISSTVFIDDKTAKDIASGILFYVGKEAMKNPDREIPEWSEEDEWKRNELLKYLEEKGDYCSTWYSWLKSLRPQPKAELTLLDENIINAAVAFVEQNDHFNCWRGIDKHTVIKALRALKPHWKPSEEQMDALADATMRDVFPNGNREHLESLYNDLKSNF